MTTAADYNLAPHWREKLDAELDFLIREEEEDVLALVEEQGTLRVLIMNSRTWEFVGPELIPGAGKRPSPDDRYRGCMINLQDQMTLFADGHVDKAVEDGAIDIMRFSDPRRFADRAARRTTN